MRLGRAATALLAIAVAVPLMGQEGCDTTTKQSAKDSRGSQPDRPTAATPEPDGTFDGTCSYLLGDFTEGTEGGYKLVAGGTVENTGNVGIVATVKVRWTMLGGEPVVRTKRVRVRRGGSKEVQLKVLATQGQIDAHQAAEGKCKTDVAIIDTFGKARD